MTDFFTTVPEPIRFEGPESDNPLAFRWYDADRVVGEKTMAEHLRMAVCYWHSFNWPGNDVFGDGTFDRPWLAADLEPMEAARTKMAAAFEFFEKLGVPYFCFHDHDVAPTGSSFAEQADVESSMMPRPRFEFVHEPVFASQKNVAASIAPESPLGSFKGTPPKPS